MAKKKTTTKVKTKKTTKKTSAAKAKAKTINKKATKAVTTKRALLSKLNVINVTLSLLAAVVAYFLMSKAYVDVTVTYLAPNALESETLQSAYRLLKTESLQFLLIATLILAAVKPLMNLTRSRKKYEQNLKNEYMPLRFVDHGVQYALFASIAAAVLGYTDLITIKLVAAVAILIALFAWLAEKYQASATKAEQEHALHYNTLGIISIAVLTLYLGFSLIFTYIFGKIMPEWHVVLLWALAVLFMLLNFLNQRYNLQGKKNFKDYKTLERNYSLIGIAARLDLAAILILGFLK